MKRTARTAGFTLIEMIVVMTIIGLLMGIVTINMGGRVDAAQTRAAKVQISILKTSLEMFRVDCGRYPGTQEALPALVVQPVGLDCWSGPYLEKLPNDPWGRPYQYRAPGEDVRPFDVFSLGADGAPGGSGKDTDVTSWY